MGLGETIRKLWLMRHAEAEHGAASGGDHARRLTSAGAMDARRIGAQLRADVRPDWVVSSDAVRARCTAVLVCDTLGEPALHVIEEPRLYESDPATLLDILQSVPPDRTAVLLVAHNPTVTDALNMLCPGTRVPALATAAAAELAIRGAWCDLRSGAGRLVRIIGAPGGVS
jgi:phosphohistidine phosphatase